MSLGLKTEEAKYFCKLKIALNGNEVFQQFIC